MIANQGRLLVRVLRALCLERGIAFTALSHDWLLRLEKDGQVRHVFGYTFDLNTAAAQQIAADKSATAEVLARAQVPHVAHTLFLQPAEAEYVRPGGNWRRMLDTAEAFGWPVVVKPNAGTGGDGVYKVSTPLALEQAAHTLFQRERALALSPFYADSDEYRLVVLDGACLLGYGKTRPHLLGDGVRTVLDLLADYDGEALDLSPLASRLREVPAPGEAVWLDWRHNLGQGAAPTALPSALAPSLEQLALDAARAIGVRFASVDVLVTDSEARVLEVNAGVMLEHYARHQGEEAVRRIYGLACWSERLSNPAEN